MASEKETGSAPRRSAWKVRLLLPLFTFVLLFGVDRLAYCLWYMPTYAENDNPLHGNGIKNFLRFVPDQVLEWRYHRSTTLKLSAVNLHSGQEVRYDIATNSRSYRGPEFASPKPAGTLRIVAMGGSATSGDGVPFEMTYPRRLARSLDKRLSTVRVEAVNAGVDAYGSGIAMRQYPDVRTMEPDLLIIALDVNDGHGDAFIGDDELARRGPPPRTWPGRPHQPMDELVHQWEQRPRLMPWLHESGLFMTMLYGKNMLKDLSSEHGWLLDREAPPARDSSNARRRCPRPRKSVALALPPEHEAVAEHHHFISGLDRMAARDGVPILYLSIPLVDVSTYDIVTPYPYSLVKDVLASQRPDRLHVAPREALCEHPVSEVYIDTMHPTALGHEIIARALEAPAARLLEATKKEAGR